MHSAEALSILYYLNYKMRKNGTRVTLIYSWTLTDQALVHVKSVMLFTSNFHRT